MKKSVVSDQTSLKTQNDVMRMYQKQGAIKGEIACESLQRFFSPSCVPRGMTKNEIQLCLSLLPLRLLEKGRYEKEYGKHTRTIGTGPILPPEWLSPLKMTRERFHRGLCFYHLQLGRKLEPAE